MNSIITVIITNIFHIIWFCNIVAEPKCSRKKTVLIVIGTTFIYECITLIPAYLRYAGILSYEKVSITFSYFIFFLIGMIIYIIMFCFLLSASHPVKSMFLLTGYLCMWSIIYGIISIVTNSYAGSGNVVIWGLRIGLNLAVLIPYLLFFRERLFRMYKQIQSGYGMISAISIMCFIMQALFLFYNDKMRNHEPFFVVLILSGFAFMVAVYVMIFRYMAQSDHTNRMRQLQANEKFLQAQIDSYKKMGENARQTRHDFRHHSMVVMEYAKKKDYQSILSYLSEYDEKERGKYQEAFCKNHAISTTLSAYASRCEQNGIELGTDVRLEETEGVSDYDLVTIVANILENAINGCMLTEGKRWVEISIGPKGGKLVVICKNTCIKDIIFENGLPKNREHDGIGVESILSTAAKYSGVVDFSASDGVFVCQVILSNREKQK
ncbi:MAG: GHKL domain-containing protein [Lachnospiraceae bacterium]|nr:GHKL domain-containing protein [Lachnospiraceae bacterium]